MHTCVILFHGISLRLVRFTGVTFHPKTFEFLVKHLFQRCSRTHIVWTFATLYYVHVCMSVCNVALYRNTIDVYFQCCTLYTICIIHSCT